MMIGDLARRAGVRQSAIRYYESVGLLPPPARQSGRRVYDPAAVTQVQVISAARALGFGIREIRTLTQGAHSVTDRWRALARRKLPELESLIGRATRMKRLLEAGLHCSCVRMEDCILHECAPPVVAPRTLVRGGAPQAGPSVACRKE
jgi:MerR family redox-sensitive transcriptional activator SoxR